VINEFYVAVILVDFLVVLRGIETNIIDDNLTLQKFDITTIETHFKIQDILQIFKVSV